MFICFLVAWELQTVSLRTVSPLGSSPGTDRRYLPYPAWGGRRKRTENQKSMEPLLPESMRTHLAVRARGITKCFGDVIALDGVAGFVDGPGLYPSLTARRNLAALSLLRGQDPRAAAVDEVLNEVGLTDVADDRVRGFSLGMRQRLGLAAALLTMPRLLVLDEPVNGLDPAGKNHVHRVLTGLAAEGAAVVLSSHRMDDVDALCSEVTIVNRGRVAFSGP